MAFIKVGSHLVFIFKKKKKRRAEKLSQAHKTVHKFRRIFCAILCNEFGLNLNASCVRALKRSNEFCLFVVVVVFCSNIPFCFYYFSMQYFVVLIALSSLFGVCLCSVFLPQIAPVPRVFAGPAIAAVQPEPYDPAPQYSFAYNIQDSLTGDHKRLMVVTSEFFFIYIFYFALIHFFFTYNLVNKKLATAILLKVFSVTVIVNFSCLL